MPYHLRDKKTLYTGTKLSLEIHHLDDENTGRKFKREIVVHPGAVVIVPMLDDKTVLLIKNYRYTVGRYLLEIPAGTLEKGEPPLNCAGRELQEETGYLAKKLKPIASFYASPGILTEKMHLFVAYDLTQTIQDLDESEDIEVVPTNWDDAIDMIRSGQIEDSKTIAALLMVDRFFKKP
jgi:ADP-ribose pyrophosphatase